jgi:hypothetical protein
MMVLNLFTKNTECGDNMKVEIDVEEITRIVSESLQLDYEYNSPDESPEFPGLLNAIEIVLSYYMSPSEYDKWLDKVKGEQ